VLTDLTSLHCTYSELEEELERTRVFYTKKVEEGHRKYEAQIRALKRGTAGEEVAVPQSAAVAPQPQQQQLQEQMQQATAVYAERIALLERELMSTAEELGRVKASAQSAPQSKPTHAPTEHDLYRQQHLVKVTELERQEMLSTHQQRLEEVKAYHSEFVAQLQSQWGTERASLQQRLRDEEARCAELRGELMSAVRGAASAPMGAASAVSYRSASDGKHFAVSHAWYKCRHIS
jgi:chromosome segregation ATPase